MEFKYKNPIEQLADIVKFVGLSEEQRIFCDETISILSEKLKRIRSAEPRGEAGLSAAINERGEKE